MRVNTENVRYYRNKENLSQKELAEKTGFSYPMISAIDRGNERTTASEKLLSAVAIVLKVNLRDLVIDEGDVSPFEFLSEKTKKHLEEQGYTEDTWDASNAPQASPTDNVNNIEYLAQLLSMGGYTIDIKRTDIDAGHVVISSGKNHYKLPVASVRQYASTLHDFAGYSLHSTIQEDGEKLSL